MSTSHSVASGLLIAIGLLSVVGFVRLLMLPFDIASRALFSVADAKIRAADAERIYRKQVEARLATEKLLRRYKEEAPDERR